MTWKPYTLHDVPVWVEPDTLETGNGPIAPPEHIKDGELLPDAIFMGISYAHCYSGTIKRFTQIIGNISDLKPREN